MNAVRSHRARLLAVSVGVTFAIVCLLWLYTEQNESYIVPTLPDVLDRFQRTFLFAEIGSEVVPSVRRLLLGFGLAVVVGVSAGLALGMLRRVRLTTQPVLALLRSIPPVTMIPPAILLLGLGDSMKVAVIAIVCVWPVLLNTADGVAELDSTVLATARAFGLRGRRRLQYVIVPAISPRIFAGMRTSLGFALLMVIAVEFLASTDGLGFLISEAQITYRVADMWAGILMLGILGFLLNLAFSAIERRALRWNLADSGRGW